VSLSAVDVS